MDSHIRPSSREPNQPTQVFTGHAPRPMDLRDAYTFAHGLTSLVPHDDREGHRLVWMRGSTYASRLLVASGDAFVVVGRHTQCSVSLPEDPFVALRHLLVRSVALPSGGVALRVFDLHTGVGFFLADGSAQTSVLAEGPVAFSVGDYALVALPSGGAGGASRDEALPKELPSLDHEGSALAREQLAALEHVMSPYRANARPSMRSSRITRLPMPVMVGEPPPQSTATPGRRRYEISLSRRGASASVALTDAELARGVVIGRSEKCVSATLRRVTEMGTSRVHLLVVREGADIHAYDLASTQGTFHGKKPVSRARLPEQGTTALLLGTTPDAVQFGWRAT